ncbi:MAG: GCN5-related N-acetyltransferase [Pseudomonadota bacterium]
MPNDLSSQDQLPLPGLGGRVCPVRAKWRRLVEIELPAEAKNRDWPVTEDHCFARILLDNAAGQPWRNAVKPPAWRNAPEELLTRAIDLGAACINGTESLQVLNENSLKLRGKA